MSVDYCMVDVEDITPVIGTPALEVVWNTHHLTISSFTLLSLPLIGWLKVSSVILFLIGFQGLDCSVLQTSALLLHQVFGCVTNMGIAEISSFWIYALWDAIPESLIIMAKIVSPAMLCCTRPTRPLFVECARAHLLHEQTLLHVGQSNYDPQRVQHN